MTTRVGMMGLILAAGATACGSGHDTGAASDTGVPVDVTVGRVSVTPVPAMFEVGGVLVSRQSAVVASRVMAPILRVLVQPGERVRRGQLLVELDAADATAQAARARAGLEGARATAGVVSSERDAAEAAVVLAKASHARIERLHAERSATAQELDVAVAALRQAEARLAMATAQARATDRAIDAADAGARAADIQQSWAALTSPFDGLIAARHADPGSMASPGQPLLVVEALGAWQMEVRVDASRTAGLAVGQTADVQMAGTGVDAWTVGRVSEIARVDPASHSFVVTIDLAADTTMRSGLFGRARFRGPSTERLSVPADAVVTRGQLTFVYVVGADAHVRLRSVSLGESMSGRTEVLAGLADGDRVVLRPSAGLADGASVRAVDAPQVPGEPS